MAIDKITTPAVTDDSITLAKMAPGTDGNLITYDASGNPAAVATGSAGQVLTSAGAGAPPTFATPASATNTPSFHASMTSNNDFTDGATTNCVFNSEEYDSDSKYNTSDGWFTPTVSGRYWLYSLMQFDSGNELEGTGGATLHIRKNGSVIAYYSWKGTSGSFDTRAIYYVGVTTTSDTNDYFNVTFRQDTGNTWSVWEGSSTAYFGGYKLIT